MYASVSVCLGTMLIFFVFFFVFTVLKGNFGLTAVENQLHEGGYWHN